MHLIIKHEHWLLKSLLEATSPCPQLDLENVTVWRRFQGSRRRFIFCKWLQHLRSIRWLCVNKKYLHSEQGCDTIPLTQNCELSFCFHCLIFSSFLCILFTTEGQRSQPVPLSLTSWGFPSSPADRGRQTAGRRRSRLLCSLWRETHSQWVETEESFFPFISPSAQH